MNSLRSLIDPGGRLARSLDRLHHTLDTLGGRLRDAVSSAVGETVAGIVQETVRAVLADLTPDASVNRPFAPPPRPSTSYWAGPQNVDDDPWFEDPDYDSTDEDEPPFIADPPALSRQSRWSGALTVGVRTTLCWLRRRTGRFPVLAAVGAGVLTALATYAGGPIAAAVVGLAGSALGLLSLAEAVQAGADALAAFRP